MAWTTMHFAAGMACTAGLGTAACLLMRRGWRWLPAAMTAGGLWALVPDLPRIWREDFPGLPMSGLLGSKSLERRLHAWGDVFFFHQSLDTQPHELALLGLVIILVLYNAALAGWLVFDLQQRGRSRRRDTIAQRHREALAGLDHSARPIDCPAGGGTDGDDNGPVGRIGPARGVSNVGS